jgi:hypothetical protein
MPKSQNGWPANDISRTASFKVPGTVRAFRFAKGPAGELLSLFFAWFDKNIESIDNEPDGIFDDWGYAERNIRGSQTTVSNHASGTAGDANSDNHPLGAVNTFPVAARNRLRAKLVELGGVIRWGGNYSGRKDEMHFEINVPPTTAGIAAINRAIAKLKAPVAGGSTGKGPVQDDTTPTISTSVIKAAQAGTAYKAGTYQYNDVAFLLAWARRLTEDKTDPSYGHNERVWRDMVKAGRYKDAGDQLTGVIERVQRHAGLAVDGVYGPKTAALLAHDGYKITP